MAKLTKSCRIQHSVLAMMQQGALFFYCFHYCGWDDVIMTCRSVCKIVIYFFKRSFLSRSLSRYGRGVWPRRFPVQNIDTTK
jgi:hypothetical protein